MAHCRPSRRRQRIRLARATSDAAVNDCRLQLTNPCVWQTDAACGEQNDGSTVRDDRLPEVNAAAANRTRPVAGCAPINSGSAGTRISVADTMVVMANFGSDVGARPVPRSVGAPGKWSRQPGQNRGMTR